MTKQTLTDDIHLLTATLPEPLQHALEHLGQADLLEIILDLGRRPQARLSGRAVDLSGAPVSRADLDLVVQGVGRFGADNRAGIEGTLHRISVMRNRRGEVVGLTLRVGRAVFGTIDLIRDLVETERSVLLLGRPGIGKTTKLREVARVLADEMGRRVIVIDTSNEIAGDGDVPHPAIGSARRMQVAHPDRQHAVMIEAVENHMPEVIIVDEIGTEAEAMAARTIAERGVQLIGTAHGTTLENLVRNPTLADLVGGVQTVTLGDEEARFRGTQKTVAERKGPPTFDAVVEIVDRDEVIVHADTAEAVDLVLRGLEPGGVRRTPSGETALGDAADRPAEASAAHDRSEPFSPTGMERGARIWAYALGPGNVEKALRELRLDARVVRRPEQADLILSLRSREEDLRLQRIRRATGAPVHTVKKNSASQIRRLLQNLFNLIPGADDLEVNDAVRETESAIQRVLEEGAEVELAPRTSALRRLQHRIVARHLLMAESVGSEPERRLVIHPRI
ncbi:MAG: R3H domain-containing nucleic acid-binding protein [Chromatiales bacterium]